MTTTPPAPASDAVATAPPASRGGALREGRPRRQPVPLPDEEVRRDTKGTGVGLIILAVLGGIGLTFYLGVVVLSGGPPSMLLAGLLSVLILALGSTAVMFLRTAGRPQERSLGRVARGTLASCGVVVIGGVLMVLALGIFLFTACKSPR